MEGVDAGGPLGRINGTRSERPLAQGRGCTLPVLTPRQLECLRWAAEGKSSVDIASILCISPATVDGHIADACARLGVRTRIQAIVEAYRRGWLE